MKNVTLLGRQDTTLAEGPPTTTDPGGSADDITAADVSVANPFEEPVLLWDEDRTEFRRTLLIDATSYQPEPLFPLRPR